MKGFWRGHAFCPTMLDLDPDVLATVLELLNLADLSRLMGVSRALFQAASEEERGRSTMGLPRVVALVEQPSCLAPDGGQPGGGWRRFTVRQAYGTHL
jgi:hypothetical protein